MSETHYSLKEMETCKANLRLLLDFDLSETHYSLKEMETRIFHVVCIIKIYIVGNPLLSERDGNELWTEVNNADRSTGRKPTTLWKRWKPFWWYSQIFSTTWLSETHYSLKEMETSFFPKLVDLFRCHVGNPLLSERDGNLNSCCATSSFSITVGNPLLSVRDGNLNVHN